MSLLLTPNGSDDSDSMNNSKSKKKKYKGPHFDFVMSINGPDNKKAIITWAFELLTNLISQRFPISYWCLIYFFSTHVYFYLVDNEVVLAVPQRRPVVPHQLDKGQGENLLRLVSSCRKQRRKREGLLAGQPSPESLHHFVAVAEVHFSQGL